eukprot:gene14095-14214_t
MLFDRLWKNAHIATLSRDIGDIRNGAIGCVNGQITFVGAQAELPATADGQEIVDCGGRWITPGLIDAHSHIVHGGNRAAEFEQRLGGASYEDIAKAGGGIVSTVRATRNASQAELVASALPRLDALIAEGLTTIEIKSGYGLNLETELNMLRAARQLGHVRPVHITTTFLGAHALPPETSDKDAYISDACAILDVIHAEKLADAVDGFCESIAFSSAQISRVFDKARSLGLPVKLHADQLSNSGGAALAAKFGALSADHVEYTDEAGVIAMAKSGTVATLLPGAFYFIRETQKPPVQLFRKHQVPMALATDNNPGTSPLTSLLLTMNMGATLFRLTVEECLAGVTRNAAKALGRKDIGTLEVGKSCDLAIWNIEDIAELWRLIYEGASLTLDPACLPAVAASAATVAAIVAKGEPVYGINTGFGKLASIRIDAADLATLQRNIVLSHAAGIGEAMPVPIVRLMMALKLASLARGASGISLTTLKLLENLLQAGLTPVVPAKGSVGASGDLAPLSHMTAAMIGVGHFIVNGEKVEATKALQEAGLAPLTLGPKEGLALLNGTQFSTANALAGLFEAETLFQSALMTGALSTDAARGSDAPFDPRIHSLRGHRGQIETAAALRNLMSGSAIRASHLLGDERVQDPYCLRCQPQVMGAALDILRQAATTLAIEANGVSDNPLVFADTGEALSGGNFHAEPVAFAADIIALAICEIGSIAERRIAMLVDPALSGLPAFLTPKPGLNSGFMIPQVTAAALVSENKQMAYPASVDSIPTSANQEDHVSMAAHGARRLRAMAENAFGVIAIELLAAAQGCDFHAPLASSPILEALRMGLRKLVPHLDEDRHFHPDIETALELVRSGAIASLGMGILPIKRGSAPLLISLPHTGTELPAPYADSIISPWLARKDTDWWIDQLYDFASDLGATLIRTRISRSIIDVNRDPAGLSLYPGQATTELCPTTTFDGEALYNGAGPDENEVARRRAAYFTPYHAAIKAELARLRAAHDHVVLYDGHSIRSIIPRLFDGILPVFNLGTHSGTSCAPELEARIAKLCAASSQSSVVNGRFKGGYITRHYGAPHLGIHALQMELACRAYIGQLAHTL